MKVVQFLRKPGPRAFSIERLFQDIRSVMPRDIVVEVSVNRYVSRGFVGRLYDVFRVVSNQGDVNHITGDVHFLATLMNRKKTILTIHDCVTLARLKGIRYWVYWFFWYWLPIRRAKVITVISKSTQKELQAHINIKDSRIKIIPNCVSAEFKPLHKKFNSEYPRILQIGTKDNKNLERVAAALEGLSCCLIIVGQLTAKQKELLGVHRIDVENHVGISRDALVALYQQADLVMFASLYEGFGLPILESNAVGRPVITSKLFSMPEVGGDAACYVDPYDTKSIRVAAQKVFGDSEYRDGLVENGYRNAERFRATNIADQYASLYRRVHKERSQLG